MGGHVHTEKDGRVVFIIERQVKGHRFHVSTRCNTERAALKQLERFEADPFNYRPEGGDGEDPVPMTHELIIEFEKWSIEKRGNTPKHAREMSRRLNEWAQVLSGVDLRKATLRSHVAPALEKWAGQQHRIIALKSFYAWLRKTKHLLTSANDPTLDLPVPQGTPEKHRRRKAVSWEDVEKAFRCIDPAYRDMLQLLAATGWHTTELERFARDDESEIIIPSTRVLDKRGNVVLAVLMARHKTGGWTRTPLVEPVHVAAAKAFRERRSVPRRANAAVKAACVAAGVPVFTLGVMRHSVATWAIELGATEKEASEYLGHESKKTTRMFYIDVAVPTATVPTRVLT